MKLFHPLWHTGELANTYLGSCQILSTDQSLEVLADEPSSARPMNASFLPVDRADTRVINRYCGDTPRGIERIPSDIFTINGVTGVPINMQQDWSTMKGIGEFLRVNKDDLDCRTLSGIGFPFEGENKTMDLFECKKKTTAGSMTVANVLNGGVC